MAIASRSFGTQQTLNLVPSGLANSAGISSDLIDFTTEGVCGIAPAALMIHFQVAVASAIALTAGNTIQFFWARGDDSTPIHIDGNIASAMTTTAPTGFTWAQTRDLLQFCFVQPVIATANMNYKGSFMIFDPGPRGALVLYNATGQSLNGDPSRFYFRYSEINTSIS